MEILVVILLPWKESLPENKVNAEKILKSKSKRWIEPWQYHVNTWIHAHGNSISLYFPVILVLTNTYFQGSIDWIY